MSDAAKEGCRVPEACVKSILEFYYAEIGCLIFCVPRILARNHKRGKVIMRSTVLAALRNVLNEMDREQKPFKAASCIHII